MTTFVLIPGAGGVAWYWSRVLPLLRSAGHMAKAVDLPGDDETAGLEEYTQLVVEAIDSDPDVAVVAQSLRLHGRDGVCAGAREVGHLCERDDPTTTGNAG